MNALVLSSSANSHSHTLNLGPHVLGEYHGRKEDMMWAELRREALIIVFTLRSVSHFLWKVEVASCASLSLGLSSSADSMAHSSGLGLLQTPMLFRDWSDLLLVPSVLRCPERCRYPTCLPA